MSEMPKAKSWDGYEIPAVETGGGLAQGIIFAGWGLVKLRETEVVPMGLKDD